MYRHAKCEWACLSSFHVTVRASGEWTAARHLIGYPLTNRISLTPLARRIRFLCAICALDLAVNKHKHPEAMKLDRGSQFHVNIVYLLTKQVIKKGAGNVPGSRPTFFTPRWTSQHCQCCWTLKALLMFDRLNFTAKNSQRCDPTCTCSACIVVYVGLLILCKYRSYKTVFKTVQMPFSLAEKRM